MKFKSVIVLVLIIGLLVFAIDLAAQCPMCRMSAESNLKNGGTAGKGLNQGILYMLSVPYLLVTTIGIIWYRKHTADKEDELAHLN